MRRLEQRTETGASRQAVWTVLADFGGVAKWAPGMRRSGLQGDLTAGVGTRRVMRHRWGFKIEERITDWVEGESYAFVLLRAPFPMRDVHETWNLESREGQTKIITSVSYRMGLGVLGAVLDVLLVRFLVKREMRAGLRALVGYAERNSVVENIFQAPPTPAVLEAETDRRASG